MIFMNEFDVIQAVDRFTDPESAKGKAVKILLSHMNIINANSDGWCHWKSPVVAAKRLMELIQGPSTVSETTAHYCLKLAITPLRSFYTRHPHLPRPEGI